MTTLKVKMKPPPSSSPFSSAALQHKDRLSSYLFTLLAFILSVSILYGEELSSIFSHNPHQSLSSTSEVRVKKAEKLPFAVGESERGCDVFSGRWVWGDDRPLYEESDCPYLQEQVRCQEYGRPDKDYQRWRWQPHGCSLPSFNGTVMLESLRNKRMMFVGDSLNRGFFLSMVCLLNKNLPDHAKSISMNGSLMLFKAKDYNASIEFYWAPFLLESNSDDPIVHEKTSDQLVRLGSINKHGKKWKGADILVFNSYLWWKTDHKFNIFDEEENGIVEVAPHEAYQIGMKSMVRWVKKNMDPTTTRVFFTSMSPTHGRSVDWGGDRDGNCYNETSMIEDPNYFGSNLLKDAMRMIGELLRSSEFPITFLNITQLSSYRKDAHTSIYKKQWKPLTAEQLANPSRYADCVHWCLPGLQDTWTELLFAKFLYPSQFKD